MNSERWSRIEALFLKAVELDADARDQWLSEQCGADSDLRAQVERLLASDANASAAMAGAVAASVKTLESPAGEQVPRIGPYEILAEIGRGGMGVVYRARRDDDVFRKDVAVKVVKRGMDTDAILTRFLHERRILARLEHPCITRIIDGGAVDGLPYLVMEHVEGMSLSDYCVQNRLSLRGRLELFLKVCAAVEHAHQQLVVHRDLKPSNILVDGEGTPKLLDFGIAKLLAPEESAGVTLSAGGMRPLTPEYASPEQVSGEPVGVASDIYSLGAILYEMLAGTQPHRSASRTPEELLRAVCEEEIAPPARAARGESRPPVDPRELQGDLDNILLTALRRDPRERYPSVHLFADDLKRFLADLPVRARPQTLRYRTVKFLRRNRGSLFAASLAAVSLIAGTAISLHQARRADRRFQEVRSLANSFLFEIHDEIETLPGSTHARELMVRTVLRYLNNLARESDDDPSLLWELATAYQKIGDVQGYGFRPNLGQRAEALESHRRGLEIAERLAAFGYQPKVQRLLAVAHDRIGMLRSGDQPHSGAGIEHYKRSIETLERLNRSEPGSPENYRLLITTHYHLARAEMLRGQTAEAAALWHRTLALAREWESRNPGEAARLAVGTAHWSVSTARQFLGDLRGALEHARAAIAIHEPLVAAQPSSTARQRELLNSYERLSYVFANPDFLNLGDLAGAREYNRKVVAIASALYEADPRNEMAASDLAIAKRFECAFALDDAPAVVRACQEALNVSARIPRSHAEALPEVAMRLGPALARLGRRAEGVKIMESGIDSLEASLATWPWRVDLRLRLLRTHHWLGGVLLGGGNAGEALRHYQSALEIGQALLPERQQDPALLRDLADCYRSLGRFYEQRDCRQARDWHRKDLETWAEWPRHFPSTGVDQRRREGAARNLGRCAVR